MKRVTIILAILLVPVQYALYSQSVQQHKSIHQLDFERFKDFTRTAPLLEAETGPPVALKTRTAGPSREIFGYFPYWVYSNYPNLNYDLLTTVAYFGAEINEFGNIVNLRDWPATGLVNKAHSEGVRVVLTTILFVPTQIASLLSDASRRTNLVNNLLTQVQNAGADGVTIDFEGVPGSQKQNLTTFMTELSEAFHSAISGSFVTIFTPAVDWSNAFDYLALSQVTDGLVMQGYDYHWSSGATAGPVAPLTGDRWGFFSVSWTVTDYLGKTFRNTSKLMLAVPYYGFDWPTVDDGLESSTRDRGNSIFYSEAYPNAMQYGRLWDAESQTPWYKYNDGGWQQGWYDDSLSLAKKYEMVNAEDLKGIAIWALSYDGQRQELQGALSDAFGATAAPLKPVAFRVKNVGDGGVEVAGRPSAGATSYRIYRSTDGENFGSGVVFPGAISTLTNLSTDSTYYFKIAAVNGNGESNFTEVLTVRPTNNSAVDILIVNGFDRTVGTVNTFDFVKRVAPSIERTGRTFDSCSNESVINGETFMRNYSVVVWISGEEGTADESFSNAEQALIADYLEHGGNLFVSGSEIGYDLVERGTSSDKGFYRNYLKAQYIRDKVATHAAAGISGGLFTGIGNLAFDDGTHGTYNVDFPDGIKPIDGSIQNVVYSGFDAATFGGAGVEFDGEFAGNTMPGRVIYLGFPFETLYPESTRDAVMERALDFLDRLPTSVADRNPAKTVPGDFQLAQNYPNPFNPATTISFILTNLSPVRAQLKVFNVLGQEVVTLLDEVKAAGNYAVVWDGRTHDGLAAPSGIYLYRLQVGNRAQMRKMTLVK